MSIPWDKIQKTKAKKEKLFLFKMTLQGKHAGLGFCDVASTVTPIHAMALHILSSDENLADAVLKAAGVEDPT